MVRKVARNTLALACLLVGIAGLFLPFIQGIAMILLSVWIADFEAKEHLLERASRTRLGRTRWGRRLYEHHLERRRRGEERNGLRITPESALPPPPTGEARSEEP